MPDVSGRWTIDSIGMVPKSIRTVIWASNKTSKAKFLLNWKNPFTYNGNKYPSRKGRQYPAKLGLIPIAWNV